MTQMVEAVRGVYVGIDVSKARLDVFVDGERFAVSNDDDGYRELIARLRRPGVVAIGLEDSGGYERRALRALLEAGLPARRVDAYRVRQLAKALGQLAKTDPIDAEMIARYLSVVPAPMPVTISQARAELRRLVTFRRRQVADRVALDNQLAQIDDPTLQELQRQRLEVARKVIARVEQLIGETIAGDTELHRQAALLQSAPGIGFIASATLLADMPELGQLGPKQIAALLGVAPFQWLSGNSAWPARIHGGRRHPRNVLYLAVLVQIRRCPWARAYRDRLVQRGKAKKVAVVALMRKLIVSLNAMLKRGTAWHAEPPATRSLAVS